MSRLVRSFALASLVAQSAHGQIIGGRVLDNATRRPLAGVEVEAVEVLSRARAPVTRTDSNGVFYLDLPARGTYHVTFTIFPHPLMSGDTVPVWSDDFVEKQYLLAVPPDPVFFEFQVHKPVAPQPRNRAPRYPLELRQRGIGGHVLVQFVVDTMGQVERDGMKILRSTDALFSASVIDALLHMSFHPAEYNGRRVRQLVQQPFNFCVGSCR